MKAIFLHYNIQTDAVKIQGNYDVQLDADRLCIADIAKCREVILNAVHAKQSRRFTTDDVVITFVTVVDI